MRLTIEYMEDLSSADRAKAAAITDTFEVSVKQIEQGCRDKDLRAQLAASAKGQEELGQFLRVAATNYTVPKVQQPYSAFRP